MKGINLMINSYLENTLSKGFHALVGSALLCSIGGVDFNVLGNLAELVREFEMNADIAVCVGFDVVYPVREDFTGQCFDALILCKEDISFHPVRGGGGTAGKLGYCNGLLI